MTPEEARRAGLRDSILRRLEDLPRQYAALENAMASFGDDFDRDAFAVAFESADDLDAYNRVQAIEQGFTRLQNYVVELAAAGAELAGLRGKARAHARRDLELLRDAGMLSGAACERLVQLQAIRNLVQHAYAELDAGQLHEAVQVLDAELPAFARAYRRWIDRYL